MTARSPRYISDTETAKLVRKMLKAAFPATKFSVVTRRVYGISVSWTDGPTRARVNELTAGLCCTGFDGSIDLAYSVASWVLNGEIIGTRSRGTEGSGGGTVAAWGLTAPHDDAELVQFGANVTTHRQISPALAEKCAAKVAQYYHVPMPTITRRMSYDDKFEVYRVEGDTTPVCGHYWEQHIWRAAEDATRYTLTQSR